LSFFDRVLKRKGEPPPAPVRYFSVGSGWKWAPTWPPPDTVLSWTAASGGGANSRHGDGRLVLGPADPGPPDVFVAEPLVPYLGGLVPLESEAAAEDRRDVLCYTSDLITEPLSIAGAPRVKIVTKCDMEGHDVVVSLVSVGPDGEPRALTSGVRRARVTPGALTPHSVELRPIAWTIPKGSRLRLDVTAARFPAFDRNPHNSARAVAATPREDYRVATIEVLEATLELPIEADP
jgi:putative CocE/NonD family hydrolase